MRISQYIKKNGEKVYRIKGYLGIDPITGKEVEISRQGFATKKDAQLHFLEEQNKFEAKLNGEIFFDPITFEEMSEKWLNIYKLTVSESTLKQVIGYFDNYILPAFGNIYLDKFTPVIINNKIIEWPQRTTKSQKIFRYAKRVFALAIDLGYLNKDPSEGLNPPKIKKVHDGKKRLKFLEKDELTAYLEAAEEHLPHQWFVYIRLLAMSGMRRAEALALMPSDLHGNVIEVNKTLSTGLGGKQIVNPPKTPKSYRKIRMDQETMDLLKGLIKDNNTPIFSKADGNYWSLSRPRHHMVKLSQISDAPLVNPHMLRHTHCSLLFEAGAGIREVQDRLGHETVNITLEIYNHVSAKRNKETVNKLVDYLGY